MRRLILMWIRGWRWLRSSRLVGKEWLVLYPWKRGFLGLLDRAEDAEEGEDRGAH